jgi:DNA-binding response OmpR family regulator
MIKSVNILLIEDNDGDVLLTTEALFDHKIINHIKVIQDGREAIDFFETLSNESGVPYLVLLDINLPKVSGHEILKYIKNSKYNATPVIMLTTSSSEKDRILSETNKVDSYMTKPLDVPALLETIKTFKNFCFDIVHSHVV